MRFLFLATLPLTDHCWGPPVPVSADADKDGYHVETDCDDSDPAIHPFAEEIDGNCVDENCDNVIVPGAANDAVEAGVVVLCGDDHGRAGGAIAVAPRAGAADLLVGAPYAREGGAVYVVPSEAVRARSDEGMIPLSDLASATLLGPSLSEAGTAVLGRDMDGDEVSDILVGAPKESSAQKGGVGALYLFLGNVNGTLRLSGADIHLVGPDQKAIGLGSTLVAGHIVDPSSLADVLVGAPDADSAAGAAWLLNGLSSKGASELTVDNVDVVFSGGHRDDHVGSAMVIVDAEGDGMDDALIGAPGLDAAGSETSLSDVGGAYLLLGDTAAAAGASSLWDDLVRLPGSEEYGAAGSAVGGGYSAWKNNGEGDGIAQLLVATNCGSTLTSAPYTPCTDVAWLLEYTDGAQTFPLSEGMKVASWTHVSELPVSLSFQDLDGDNDSDLVIGMPAEDQETGAVYAIHGPLDGNTTLDGDVDLPAFMKGEERYDLMGASLTSDTHFGSASEEAARVILGAPGRGDDGAVYLVPGLSAFGPDL